MASSSKKSKKSKSNYEDRPEYQTLRQSLLLIRDFGYIDPWSCDSDFVESFNLGGHCLKYQDLLNFLERELEINCKAHEMGQIKATLSVLRGSTSMDTSPAVPTNPIFYRLTTVNFLVNKLLDCYMNNLSYSGMTPLNNLYSNSCGPAVARANGLPSRFGCGAMGIPGSNSNGSSVNVDPNIDFERPPTRRGSLKSRMERLRELARGDRTMEMLMEMSINETDCDELAE